MSPTALLRLLGHREHGLDGVEANLSIISSSPLRLLYLLVLLLPYTRSQQGSNSVSRAILLLEHTSMSLLSLPVLLTFSRLTQIPAFIPAVPGLRRLKTILCVPVTAVTASRSLKFRPSSGARRGEIMPIRGSRGRANQEAHLLAVRRLVAAR